LSDCAVDIETHFVLQGTMLNCLQLSDYAVSSVMKVSVWNPAILCIGVAVLWLKYM